MWERRYEFFAKMRHRERALFYALAMATKDGKWLTYDECADLGVQSPSRAMTELTRIDGMEVVKRKRNGRTLEFKLGG